MPDPWIIGQVARMVVAITDAAGAAADPGTLTLKVKPPVSALATYSYGGGVIVRDGAGQYHADIALAEAGQYRWRWESASPNAGADQGFLQVAESLV